MKKRAAEAAREKHTASFAATQSIDASKDAKKGGVFTKDENTSLLYVDI